MRRSANYAGPGRQNQGWYIPSRTDEMRGESTAWYASFWKFCASYLNERFDSEWSLSPEQSLSLHAGNWTVPRQLLVRASKAGNKVIQLPHHTSIFDVRASLPTKGNRNETDGLKLFSLEEALIAAAPTFFKQSPNDAYHSLSIEGYKVTTEMIERVRSGNWNPDENEADRAQRDAMAARGYWQSFQAVHKSVESALRGKNAGEIADLDHRSWYRELFAPSVTVGLLQPGDLAGYRSGQVYIRVSMHVPMKFEAVADCMAAFFELLAKEENAAVRVVLGHFFFVYIHPYMDGNGRIGRFLMNVMLAAGGYPWTVIPVDIREQYIDALERASVEQDIKPFARLISKLVGKKSDNASAP